MFKKIVLSALAGIATLGFVGTAMAANYELNLYGASAQFAFWNAAAKPFLEGKGCTVTTRLVSTPSSEKDKHGITVGTGCSDSNSYTIRYSSKASYDGIMALQTTTQYPLYASPCAAGAAKCGGGTVSAAEAKYYRKMVCGTGADDLACVKVDIGMSDVAGETFMEASKGCKSGANTSGWPSSCTGSDYIDRTFNGIETTAGAYNTNDLAAYNPMIVPFGFFANNCVTTTKCVAPDPLTPTGTAHKAISAWGNQCYDPDGDGKSQDCVGYFKCIRNEGASTSTCQGGLRVNETCSSINECPDVAATSTSCKRIPLDNISRLMATMIFSGQARNWQDFGAYYDGDCNLSTTTDAIIACLRHAGSGTHATMRIMTEGGGWGAGILKEQYVGGPNARFNDGSGDEIKCVSGVDSAHSYGQAIGAIGYADCDVLMGTPFRDSTSRYSYENVHLLKLDGIECAAPKIRNGEYPFYTVEWMYYDANSDKADLITELAAFAGNEANYAGIAFHGGPNSQGNEGMYWNALGEMKFLKWPDTAWPTPTGSSGSRLP